MRAIVAAILSLSIGTASASSFEERLRWKAFNKLANRSMEAGKRLANQPCEQAVLNIENRLANVGEVRGLNAPLDAIGAAIAAVKVSDDAAYKKLRHAMVVTKDPVQVLKNNFQFPDNIELACDDFNTLRQVIIYVSMQGEK